MANSATLRGDAGEAFDPECRSASSYTTTDRESRLAEGRNGSPAEAGHAGRSGHPYVVEYAAKVSVWGRWFIWLVGVFLIVYRPGFWYPQDIELLLLNVLLFSANSLVHHRLLTNRPVTWPWMLLLSATDVALTTLEVFIGGGFRSFIFVGYYPALAILAVVFPSSWLSLAWTTAAAAAYAAVCLVASPGLDLGAGKGGSLPVGGRIVR